MEINILEMPKILSVNTNQVQPNTFKSVAAEEVKLRNFPYLNLFVYQQETDGKYVVTEFYSGCAIPSSASKSKQASIRRARTALNRGFSRANLHYRGDKTLQAIWSVCAGVAHHGAANSGMMDFADYIVNLVKELVKNDMP